MPTYQIEYRIPDPDYSYGKPVIINVRANSLQKANEAIERIKMSLRVVGRLVEDASGLHV